MKEVELCTIKTEKIFVADRESVIRFNYRNNVEPVIPYDGCCDVPTVEYALMEHREYPIVAFYKNKQDLQEAKHNPFEPEIEATYIALDDNCRRVIDLFTESLRTDMNCLIADRDRLRTLHMYAEQELEIFSHELYLLKFKTETASFWKRLKFLFTGELK